MVPVGFHESVVAVAERRSVEDLLACTGGLKHTWAFLESGRAAVFRFAAPFIAFAISVPVTGCLGFGLAQLLRSCIDLLEDDGLGDGCEESGKANDFHCE